MTLVAPPDAAAESVLLLEVSTLAHRFARRLVGADAADDIAQDVVLDCLIRIRTGRWHLRRSLAAFVSAAVWRNHADLLRRSGHRGARDAQHLRDREEASSAWMDPELALDARVLDELSARAVSSLPRACRQVYAMVREERATYEAVADRLGISRATVCSHVATARRRLRRQLYAAGVVAGESAVESRRPASAESGGSTDRHASRGRRARR